MRFIMDVLLSFLIVYLISNQVEASLNQKVYAFDQRKYCPENGAHTQSLTLTDEVILLAKSRSDSFFVDKFKSIFNKRVTDCEMKFMTSSLDSNTKQALQIEFESFNIAKGACDVSLQLHQSSTQFFTKDVKEMAILTCGSPKPPTLFTEEGYVVRFQFRRPDNDEDYYNFRISIKRSDGAVKEKGISVGVKIGVTVISVAAAITILLLVYKFVKLRCETKDIENMAANSRNGSQHGSDSDEMEHLRDHDDNNFVMTDFPYANMPIVILNGDEAPPDYKDVAPPAYEEALQMPKATEEATYSNMGTISNQSEVNLSRNQATSQNSLSGNMESTTNQSNSNMESTTNQSNSNMEEDSSPPDLVSNTEQPTSQTNIASNLQPKANHSS
ncbi:uncharacterized protein LOC133203609 isoform X1 [Saccostrea echinata]|uniref:uncharacterized protein LOC133203609 isoform X1 n=1 Tax=Saccostrea echinata TaxID=191078 RepID=UPI002A8385B4|nr:uncharacterized protein LOC133203609 isoform X1 [Saccostrea echinata]